MKYKLQWTMTTYYETVVEADSEEQAREIFNEGGLDYEIVGDAGDAELVEIENIIDKNNLTYEQLSELRKQITLDSLFIRDYENDFGIPAEKCCGFFEGYSEYLGELFEEAGCYKSSEYYTVIDKFDTDDNLYNYYCMCEYPFGM